MALNLLRKTRIHSLKHQVQPAFQQDLLSLCTSTTLMKTVLSTTLAQVERRDYGRTLTLSGRCKPSPHQLVQAQLNFLLAELQPTAVLKTSLSLTLVLTLARVEPSCLLATLSETETPRLM